MRHKKKRSIREQQNVRGVYGQVSIAGQRPPTVDDETDEINTTLGTDTPIDPGQQMATQLSIQRPPIEDDEFVPGSIPELAKAAHAIAELVPTAEVEWYYKQLHKLVDDATKRSAESPEEEVKEESLRRVVRKTLKKILGEQAGKVEYFGDESEFDEYRYGASGVGSTTGPDVQAPSASMPDEMGLEDMAAEYGYSGASGIRQEINRLTDRMEYFAMTVKQDDLDALLDYAAGEYIDALEASELLEPTDIADLRSASAAIKDLDSFRFFFISGFVLPAYREVAKEARDKVMAEIEDLGLPKEIHQTVYNQVSGATKRKPQLIQKKLVSLADKGKIKPEDIKAIQDKIYNATSALVAVGNMSDDLVERSLNRWQSMSAAKRKSLLRKAMEQTAGYQEQGK